LRRRNTVLLLREWPNMHAEHHISAEQPFNCARIARTAHFSNLGWIR
jgi:hypothetical protein